MPASKLSLATEPFGGTATEMAEEINRLSKEQKAIRRNLFTQFTAQIFDEYPSLNRVVVRGYTPGFNDGDPCTHSHDTYVGVNGFAELNEEAEDENGRAAFHYVNNDENPDLAWGERYVLNEGVDGYAFNTDLKPEEIQVILFAFNAFSEAIEDLYNTDFTLTWARNRDDGKISFTHEHYDCGY